MTLCASDTQAEAELLRFCLYFIGCSFNYSHDRDISKENRYRCTLKDYQWDLVFGAVQVRHEHGYSRGWVDCYVFSFLYFDGHDCVRNMLSYFYLDILNELLFSLLPYWSPFGLPSDSELDPWGFPFDRGGSSFLSLSRP